MARQFVSVQFNRWDKRSYTYHNDGEPAAVGDRAVVETKKGRASVEVVGINVPAPAFETKPINPPALGQLL